MRLALLVGAWLGGTWLGLRADAAPLPVLLLMLAAIPAGILLRMARLSLWPAVLVGLLLLALFRVEATEDSGPALVSQDRQPVTIQGRVVTDPEATRRQTKFVLAVEAVDRGGGLAPLESRVLVYAEPPESLLAQRRDPFFRYGDDLLVQGVLERPKRFGGFDYPSYLENQGISGILRSQEVSQVADGSAGNWRGRLFDFRRRLSGNIKKALPEPQSAVVRAMLLGYRGQIPTDLAEDFRKTGASHLLAISGLHVGVMLFLSIAVAGVLMGRRRHIYLLLPFVFIWSYALISGSPVSVIRAAAMGSVFLAALALGRQEQRATVPGSGRGGNGGTHAQSAGAGLLSAQLRGDGGHLPGPALPGQSRRVDNQIRREPWERLAALGPSLIDIDGHRSDYFGGGDPGHLAPGGLLLRPDPPCRYFCHAAGLARPALYPAGDLGHGSGRFDSPGVGPAKLKPR